MGLSKENGQAEFIQDVFCRHAITLPGLRMLELGNQRIRKCLLGVEVPAKRIYELFGVYHVSIDLNGKDGALALDLGQPLPDDIKEFDVVTNFGCIEHVGNQYEAWQNVHNACRAGGLMIHTLPEEGSWPKHGVAWYAVDRIRELGRASGYIESVIQRHERTQPHRTLHSIMCCFTRGILPFVSETDFREIMQCS